ncbi:hypothetical protein [Streptomyces roseochromogenus]|uniref:Uncharacterized protein n=1 Tax=Streptomyces roseochromogenus subsp. oscitans DS 12.976 TaxID=1352936 RepID=V6L6K3_STRRC|nr:hypothetical protein [Streptomyces roseochromogenus]EST36839.1 hypothetical protein M878_00130 [Streptomyces roseochromogenus subsp. oscitans DS 12.976]
MEDVTTATGTVASDAIEQLLFAQDAPGVRAIARDTISERVSNAYESTYVLSGGRDCTANSIVAFALHHLEPLLPDLTAEQWARIDAAVLALDLEVSEDLTGANGTEPRAVRVPGPGQLTLAPKAVGQTALWGDGVREPDVLRFARTQTRHALAMRAGRAPLHNPSPALVNRALRAQCAYRPAGPHARERSSR